MASELEEKLHIANTRTERELQRLGEGFEEILQEIDLTKLPKKRKRKIIRRERVGVGRDFANENAERLINKVRQQLDRETDPAKRAELEGRIKALRETMN